MAMDINAVLQELDNLFDTGQIDKVEDFLIKNYEQAEEERDFGARLSLLNELIGYYREMTMHRQAEQTASLILATIEEAGLKGTMAEGTSLLNIATAYRFLGKPAESMKCYRRVEVIYEALLEKNDMLWAGLYNNMSLLYTMLEDYEGAVQSLQKALKIVETQEDAEIQLAVTYTNLGQAYLRSGKGTEAEAALLRAEEVFAAAGKEDYHYSGCANALGAFYFSVGNYEKAAVYYREALKNIEESVGKTENYRLVEENLRQAEERMGT